MSAALDTPSSRPLDPEGFATRVAPFAGALLMPVVWMALYGTRGQLLVGILGAVAVLLVPIVWLGAPRYPPEHWQTPTMWMITAALVGTVVHELVREMRTRAERMEMASSSDELTALPSRAAWNERLPQELSRARREGWQLSVALFALDDLVELRVSQGDAAADALLRETAFSFAHQLRGTDVLVRYGPATFAAAFPGCSLGPAGQLAERMRGLAENVTVSVGVACWDGAEDAEALMARLVAATEEAREMGSDFVVQAVTS